VAIVELRGTVSFFNIRKALLIITIFNVSCAFAQKTEIHLTLALNLRFVNWMWALLPFAHKMVMLTLS